MYFKKIKIETADIRPTDKEGESIFKVNGHPVGYYNSKEDTTLKNALMGCDAGYFNMKYRPKVDKEYSISVLIKDGKWVYIEM